MNFQDVNNLSINTFQIKGGTSRIQIIGSTNYSLKDQDNTQVSVNQALGCSGNVTAQNLNSKTQIGAWLTNLLTTTYTISFILQDVAGTGVNILQIKKEVRPELK